MLSGCPPTGIEVIPGKSTMVMLGHVPDVTFNTIGLFTIFLSLPQTLSVRKSIFSRTSSKFVKLVLGISSNFPTGFLTVGSYVRRSSSGLLVTTPYICDDCLPILEVGNQSRLSAPEVNSYQMTVNPQPPL